MTPLQTSAIPPRAEPAQRRLQIMHQGGERPAQRLAPRDHHVVVALLGMVRHNRSDRGAQAPTCAVALHRAADAPAGGIADPQRLGACGSSASLENQARCHGFPAIGSNFEELWSPEQSADGRAHRLRRTAASGPYCADGRGPAGRFWWPCASESRGAACGQAVLVDRCVSRSTLRSRWEFEGRCIEAGHRRVNCRPADSLDPEE